MSTLRTTEAFDHAVEELAEQTRQQTSGQVKINQPDEALRMTTVHAVGARIPGAVVVQIPAALDQFERVASDIAAQISAAAAAAVDERLRNRPDTITELLAQCLEDRPLIVDGRDLIGDLGCGTDPILKQALRHELGRLERFVDDRAHCIAASGNPKQAFAGGRAPFTTEELGDPTPIWESLGCQPEGYQLFLIQSILCGHLLADGVELPSFLPEADILRDQIQTELSDPEQTLLDMLCAHARPVPKHIIARRSLEHAVDFGQQLRLWNTDQSSVWVTRGWSRWWEQTRPKPTRLEWHRSLACSFQDEAQRGAAEYSGSNLLEALRHFTRAGDDEQAKQCARYGAQTLVGRARDLSRHREYGRAASLYGFVAECAETTPQRLHVSDRLHAYSLHYMWWNRNRELEPGAPLAPTIEGYRKATELWPDNAYFWSRLIRAYFYASQPKKALSALAEGDRQVPDHHAKHSILIVRTVDGLIAKDKPNDYRFAAALVWADHQPRNHRERSTFQQLEVALAQGWETAWLQLPNGPELVFHRPVRVRLEFVERKSQWIAEIAELRAAEAGDTPHAALAQLTEVLRNTTRLLLRAFTHRLAARDRLYKQILLSTIDVVASRLQAEVPSNVWVIGELVEGSGGIMFRATDDDEPHLLSPMLGSITFDQHPRLARFATDAVGRPKGAALELSDPFRGDASELWAALRARRTGG